MIASAAVLAVEAAAPALQPIPSDDRVAGSARSAANEFYAAQDETLQTGDVRRLIAAVAPTFVDHLPGATGHNRTGLIEDVIALRTALPGVRIIAEVFLVEGDKALVYVSLRPGLVSGVGTLTTPVPNVASADTIEMVRVAGGVVAERWSLDQSPATWPPTIMTPTPVPIWSPSRFATATAAGQACLASACH